jgi:hypothetical protein
VRRYELPLLSAPAVSVQLTEILPVNDQQPPARFDRVAVSRWFPHKVKDGRRTRVIHGVIINGVLMCSQYLASAIETAAPMPGADPAFAARMRKILNAILEDTVPGWRSA